METEDEMNREHHRLNGHEFEQASGVGDGQGGLACCSPRGHKESDTTERLKNQVLNFLKQFRDFPGGPGAKIPNSQGREPKSDTWSGN